MRLARGGTSDESASRSLMRGKFPSTLPAPARERPSRLAAKARAAAMDNTADQRSARAEVQAARDEAGTARARQRASWRTKVDDRLRCQGLAQHSSPEAGRAAGLWLQRRGRRGLLPSQEARHGKAAPQSMGMLRRGHRGRPRPAGSGKLQVQGARGIRSRRNSSAQKRGDGRQSSGEVGRAVRTRAAWATLRLKHGCRSWI